MGIKAGDRPFGNPRSVYLAFEVFPRPKGSTTHIHSMVGALSKLYSPVLLICLGFGDMPSWQVEGDVCILRYKIYHPNLLVRARGFADFVAGVMRELGNLPRLCVFRDPWSGYPAIGSGTRIPTMFEVNALPSIELPYTHPAVARYPAFLEKIGDMERFCILHSDSLLAVSDLTRDLLMKLGADPGRISVVPNSAAADFFDAAEVDQADPPEPRLPLPAPLRDGPWFGYFGSLHPWQGIETAIDAFALLTGGRQDLRMFVAAGAQRARVKELEKRIRKRGLADKILFHAPMKRRELAAAIASLRFTVAPLLDTPRNSVQGCCPIKILESMAAGTPVIASDLRVVRDIIDRDVDGLLVKPSDQRGLAIAMRLLLENEALRDSLGTAASRKTLAKYGPEAIGKSLEACFRRTAVAG